MEIGIVGLRFDPISVIFQRVHSADAYLGTGTGLAICKRITGYHGGRIQAEPGLGTGTAIHFRMRGPGAGEIEI